MTNSWMNLNAAGITESTRIQLVHNDYAGQKKRKHRLILGALGANAATILCSLGVLACVLLVLFERPASPGVVLVVAGFTASAGVVSVIVERRLRAESEVASAKLLLMERRLWRAGITDFTSEHAARHQQSIIGGQSGFSKRERQSPSGADLVATEKLMQSLIDLIVAPFGSITQVRADPSALAQSRKKIASLLGAADRQLQDGRLEVGVVCSSAFDAPNSEANTAILGQAALWQNADPNRRVLVCGPVFRPTQFDPWENENINRTRVYLPQLGREPSPSLLSAEAALLLAERRDLHTVCIFSHSLNYDELHTSFARHGLFTTSGYKYSPSIDKKLHVWQSKVRKCFYYFNSPNRDLPLTFDVGLSLEVDLCSLMAEFFEVTSSEVQEALRGVPEVNSLESYQYVPESNQIEVRLTSWHASRENRQDLVWQIFRSFAAFYRPDGDWKRAGSPSISLEVDESCSSRSGQFMEYLAVARHTRELIQT